MIRAACVLTKGLAQFGSDGRGLAAGLKRAGRQRGRPTGTGDRAEALNLVNEGALALAWLLERST